MATQTTNLGLNTWLPSDYMNVSELNANFNKIDNYIMCTKSEIISTTTSNDDQTNTDWVYKEYSDGTIELYAAVRMSKIKCDHSSTADVETAPYYSSSIVIHLPKQISEINSLQITAGGGAMVMYEDTTNLSRSYVSFSLAKFTKDLVEAAYLIYVDIKGRLSVS